MVNKPTYLVLILATLISFVSFLPTENVQAKTRTVLIDPGHGSSGNKRTYEGNTELQTGLKLKQVLEKKGYRVVMTREENGVSIGGAATENADNIARANIANQAKADIAIRLHSDDRSDESFWTLYPDKRGKDRTGFNGPQKDSVIYESAKLSSALFNTLRKAGFNGINKGESTYTSSGKGQLLIFSTHTNVPVVTLELYGHNSKQLREKYASSEIQNKVAVAISEAIESYFGKQASANSADPQVEAKNEAGSSSSKIDRGNKCPKETPQAGPSAGQDYRSQIATAFQAALAQAIDYDQASTELSGDNEYSFSGLLPPVNGSIAQVARSQVGYRGQGDNTKYNNYNGTQWCAYFATWVLRQAGNNIPIIGSSRETLAWYKRNGHATFTDPSQAGPGDIVVWKRGPTTGHIGIVTANNSNSLTIVEGNTSRDEVRERNYTYSQVINHINGLLGFGRW